MTFPTRAARRRPYGVWKAAFWPGARSARAAQVFPLEHTPRRASGPRTLSLVAALLLGAAAGGCAVDGATPDCPEMPVTDDPFDPELAAWREEAEKRGCVTPLGDPIEIHDASPGS